MLSKYTIHIIKQTVKLGNLIHFFPFLWNPKMGKFELLSTKSKLLQWLYLITISCQCILNTACIGLCALHFYYTEFDLGNTIVSVFMAILYVGQVAFHTQCIIFAAEHVFHLNYFLALSLVKFVTLLYVYITFCVLS